MTSTKDSSYDSNDPAGADGVRIGRLSDEFVLRYRKGETPSITEYAQQYPELADEIQQVFPTLVSMEQLATVSRGGSAARFPDTIGDFRIVSELGRGGMGVVYEAEQISLNRRVALKVLPPHAISDPTRQKRFLREVKTAAQLTHKHIVPTYSVGEEDGTYYYAMQLIQGVSLAKLLKQAIEAASSGCELNAITELSSSRPLQSGCLDRRAPSCSTRHDDSIAQGDLKPANSETWAFDVGQACIASRIKDEYVRSVARIGMQVADALEYARREGVVHRDIKPANLLMDTTGHVWIADFGLAKIEGDEITTSGEFVGTLRYMAPESLTGWSDHRSDVYGLGLTLYELIALSPAFPSNNRGHLLHQIQNTEVPSLRQLRNYVPRDLDTIIATAVEKEPANRYASAAALRDDLQRFLENRPIEAKRNGWITKSHKWCRRNPLVAGLLSSVVLLLLLISGVLSFSNDRLQRSLDQVEASERAAQQSLFDSHLERIRNAVNSTAPGRRFGGLKTVRDAVALRSQIGLSDTQTDELRNLATTLLTMFDVRPSDLIPFERAFPEADGAAFSRIDFDSNISQCAYQDFNSGDVLVREIRTQAVTHRLAGCGPLPVRSEGGYIVFGPNDRYLAGRLVDPGGTIRVRLWELETGETIVDEPGSKSANARSIAFSPDGQFFFWSSSFKGRPTIKRLDIASGRITKIWDDSFYFAPSYDNGSIAVDDVSTVEVLDQRDEVEKGIAFAHPDYVSAVAWSPHERSLATACDDGLVYFWDVNSPADPKVTFAGHTSKARHVCFHPGGQFVASWSWEDSTRFWNVGNGREFLRLEYRIRKFGKDGRSFGVEQLNNYIGRFELAIPEVCTTLPLGPGISSCVSLSFDRTGHLLAAANRAGSQLVFDVRSNRKIVEVPDAAGEAVLFDSDGEALVHSTSKGIVRRRVQQATEQNMPARVFPECEVLNDIVESWLHPTKGPGRLWLPTYQRLNYLDVDGATGAISPPILPIFVSASENGRWLSIGSKYDRGNYILSTDPGVPPLATLEPKKLAVRGRFSPDSNWLVVSNGTEIVLYSTADWSEAGRIELHQNCRGQLAFHPTKRVLAFAEKYSVRLVEIPTLSPLVTLRCTQDEQIAVSYPEGAGAIEFSPDGKTMAVGTRENTINLWHLDRLSQELDDLGLGWIEPRPWSELVRTRENE